VSWQLSGNWKREGLRLILLSTSVYLSLTSEGDLLSAVVTKEMSLVRCVELRSALFLNLYNKIQTAAIKLYNIKFYNIYSFTSEIY
jgi:hypothetical protein